MAGEIHRLRDKSGETEKITINIGFVDLGHIDLLVHEGFYSNRTDFIRTAIRNQLVTHADAVKQSIVRHTLELGLRRYSRDDLEAVKAAAAASCASRSSGLRQSPKTSRPNSRLQQSNQSPSLALFRPAKQSRRRSLIASGDQPGVAFHTRIARMKTVFSTAMRQATQLTREQNVIEATRVIQRALSGQDHTFSPDEQSRRKLSIDRAANQCGREFGSVRTAPARRRNCERSLAGCSSGTTPQPRA